MNQPKRIFFLLLFPILLATQLLASSTFEISPDMYQIDHTRKLIVTNQNTGSINTSGYDTIALDTLYKVITPINKFEIGTAYNVSHSQTKEEYQLYFTELPIINITTENNIVNEPRKLAHFSITESNGSTLSSNIGIEYRGSSSQSYPKKSFRIEFWEGEDDSITKDVSLLGLRSDDDWNLQAMYNERLRIRSKTSNDLWRMINNLYYQEKEPDAINGIRMKYSELFLNGEYRGLYCVGERVDRKQLKLKKYKDDVRGELYKGIDWRVAVMYQYCPDYSNESDIWSGFEYKYPDEIAVDWSRLHSHINYIVNSTVTDFNSQYKSHIEVSNAIDYFIFLNLLRAIDNTGKNIYVAKYKENEPYFFVPWDLDAVFGAYWNGSRQDITDDILTNGLYNRLRLDNVFTNMLNARWAELRSKGVISENSLINMFRDNHNYLNRNGIYEREEIAWAYKPEEDEFDYLSNWITKRIAFLDSEFQYNSTAIKIDNQSSAIKIYPNPASDYFYVDGTDEEKVHINIYTISGTLVKSALLENEKLNKIILNDIADGVYTITMTINNNLHKTERLIIRK